MLYQQALTSSTYLMPCCKTAIHPPTQLIGRRFYSTILQAPKKATVNETTILQRHTSPPPPGPQISGHSKIRGTTPVFRDLTERDMGQPYRLFSSTLRNAHNSATLLSPYRTGRLVNRLAASFLQVSTALSISIATLSEEAMFRKT
jgi:hypothetical protein